MPCEDCSTDDPCRCGPGETCGHCFESKEPERCQHPNKQYTGALHDGPGGCKTWLYYYACPDCKVRFEEEQPEDPPLTPEEEEELEAKTDGRPPCDVCGKFAHSFEDCPEGDEGEEAPEDEEGLSGPCDCGEGAVHYTAADCPAEERRETAPPPPQPSRRPPYAVAYSVQGHLYEVALPGDATVRAVDGALVIQHHLGPVAGICQVLPVINEESNV